MPCLTTPSGMRWHYDVSGDGPGLMFLHGWGVDRRIWQQQVKHFGRSYRVVTVDLPGHGQSSWQPLSLQAIAGELLSVLRLLGTGPWRMVASSFGGLVLLKMIDADPQVFKTVVFVGALPKFTQDDGYPYGLTAAQVEKLRRQIETDYPSIVRVFFRSLFSREERASRRYKWIQTFRRNESVPPREALLGLLDILAQEDLRPVLYRCRMPVQFINGTEDYICPPPLYAEIQARIPRARLDWMEATGHFAFLIRPDIFNQKLEDFLREVP